jgi:nicotinate-nucleotide pyrophosphorylase (carboxylating)
MNGRTDIEPAVLAEIVARALAEDEAGADVTTRSIFRESDRLSGRIVAREAGVLAGLPVARAVFRALDGAFEFDGVLEDGARLAPGAVIARCRGRAYAVLSGERVALNFLQRLSGVASLTARYVEALGPSPTRILDTRKTTPGLRALEKYAVRVGGGANHRFSLADMVLIKDNHIEAAGSIRAAVEKVRSSLAGGAVAIEVEVQNFDQLEDALPLGVDRVMLDNFDVERLARAMDIIETYPGQRPEVEISGGVTLETVAELGAVGADFISVGALTHSAASLNMNMEIDV